MAIPDPTQKGDLLVADSVPEWQLLPIGNDGEVLTVDDTKSLGVDWKVANPWPSTLIEWDAFANFPFDFLPTTLDNKIVLISL